MTLAQMLSYTMVAAVTALVLSVIGAALSVVWASLTDTNETLGYKILTAAFFGAGAVISFVLWFVLIDIVLDPMIWERFS